MKSQNNVCMMYREAAQTVGSMQKVLAVTELSAEMNKREGLNIHHYPYPPSRPVVIFLTEALIHEVLSRAPRVS